MTSTSLAQSYLLKATKRLKVLPVLMAEQAFSDVVREAQEIVELALKGMLRQVGIEPPKWHDVGHMLEEHRERLHRPTEGVARTGEARGELLETRQLDHRWGTVRDFAGRIELETVAVHGVAAFGAAAPRGLVPVFIAESAFGCQAARTVGRRHQKVSAEKDHATDREPQQPPRVCMH